MTPIVLVPGLLCTAEVFTPQIPALWQHGPVQVASTLEGGTMAGLAEALLAAAPPTFALAGISMGGYVCLEVMRRAPERVTKLALLNTSARPDTPEQVAQRRKLVGQARDGDFQLLLEQALGAILHPERRDDPALRSVNVRMGMTVGVDGLARQTEAVIGRPDSRPDLPTIRVPTVVLVGDSDPLTAPDRSEEMASAIPNAELVVVPRCGHGSTLEQPEAVNQALITWLQR